MAHAGPKLAKTELKEALKEALVESLDEERAWWREVFAEVLEDFALAEAIRQGRKTKRVARCAVDRALRAAS
jgi:hypothetical protein